MPGYGIAWKIYDRSDGRRKIVVRRLGISRGFGRQFGQELGGIVGMRSRNEIERVPGI